MTTPIVLPPVLTQDQIDLLAETEVGRRLLRERGIVVPRVALSTVTVRPYTRVVNGKVEQVSGYDYERQLLEAGLPKGDIPIAHFYGLNPQSQMAVIQSMSDRNVDMTALMDELTGFIGDPGSEEAQRKLDEATKWFPTAHALCEQIEKDTDGRITVEQAAAATAATSARCFWESDNGEGQVKYVPSLAQFVARGMDKGLSPIEAAKKWSAWYKVNNTTKTAKGEPAGAQLMWTNAAKAIQVFRDAESIPNVIGDNKERSFYTNIVSPGGTSEVTIDTHMFKMLEQALGWTSEQVHAYINSKANNNAKDIHVSSFGYTVLAQAVRNVALIYGVTPDVVQAAYWIGIQPTAHITEKTRG